MVIGLTTLAGLAAKNGGTAAAGPKGFASRLVIAGLPPEVNPCPAAQRGSAVNAMEGHELIRSRVVAPSCWAGAAQSPLGQPRLFVLDQRFTPGTLRGGSFDGLPRVLPARELLEARRSVIAMLIEHKGFYITRPFE